MDEKEEPTGLGTTPESEWPTITEAESTQPWIKILSPGSDKAKALLKYLNSRITMSERAMGNFYDRWRVNERKHQAYIDLPNYDKKLKEMNKTGAPPMAVDLVIPYSFATINTIVTYLLHTFAGRKPIFQVGSNSSDGVAPAQKMEIVLQYNADHTRLVKHLYQFLYDGQIYGLSVLRCQWKRQTAIRTIWKMQEQVAMSGLVGTSPEKIKAREERLVYEGNEVCSIDPFMFFPDPRVPMCEVNKKGEFVFWKDFLGKHTLRKLEAAGEISYVDQAGRMQQGSSMEGDLGGSNRNLLSQGEAQPGNHLTTRGGGTGEQNYYEVFQGSVEIIPSEHGLPGGDKPVKAVFMILNRNVIAQAQLLELDHDMHPVVVSEPYSMGYGFGQAGLIDYTGPFQDLLSWLVNSHMENVRTAINNMFVIDPSKVEMQDLKKPGAGKLIRLKRTAYGQDVRTALTQLPVQDVTRGHAQDFEALMRVADSLASVNDNLRGLQDSGGRKTATEVRTSGEAGASRLAALARVISAQALVDLAEQMCLNNQQNLTDEFYLEIVGREGETSPMRISPEMLVGDFHFPVHDGTLPLDKVAMLDVWKEIFLGVAADPGLRQQFNLVTMFKYIAQLGGARNIEQFEIRPGSPEDIENQVRVGNMIPAGGGGSGPSGVINANPIDPSQRAV